MIAAMATVAFSFAQSNSIIKSAIHGAIAAAVSITLVTSWNLIKPYLNKKSSFRVLSMIGLTLYLHYFIELSAIDIIIISACLGGFFPNEKS